MFGMVIQLPNPQTCCNLHLTLGLVLSFHQLAAQWIVTTSPRKKFCGQEGEGEGAEHEVARRQRYYERRRHVVSSPAKSRELFGHISQISYMAAQNH